MQNKQFYIVTPTEDINSLCEGFLDRDTSFHSAITVIDEDGAYSVPAWEVSLSELRTIYKSAIDKGISTVRFKVATRRTQRKETFRWVQKKEFIKGYQSQNKRPENLARIIKERKDKIR